MGCFWGAERKFWELGDGIYTTAVGYAGGHTPNPTYEEVCSGRTGHNEVVLVVYDPKKISYEKLLKTFWENHDPTQGMRQGNDVGTQYRSGIYATTPAQKKAAEESKAMFGKALAAKRFGAITTEIVDAPPFYFAEDYHQQYLAKNPMGYCGLGGTGVSCPIGTGVGARRTELAARMNAGGPRQRPSLFYGWNSSSPNTRNMTMWTAPCSMLVRSPPNVSVETTSVRASSTICSWPMPRMVGMPFHHAQNEHRRDGQTDGGEHRAERDIDGALQAVSQGGLQRAHRLRRQHQHGHDDAGQSQRRASGLHRVFDDVAELLGEIDRGHQRQQRGTTVWNATGCAPACAASGGASGSALPSASTGSWKKLRCRTVCIARNTP